MLNVPGMSRTSLLSVTACAMCPSAAPTERDRALAGGAPTGRGYHVALHTPSVFGAPVDYHPTALLVGTAGEGQPVPDPRSLIPGSRSYSPLEGPSGRPPLTGGGPAAVINDADTWRAPAYIHISGERCSYLPWNPAQATGHPTPAAGPAPETGPVPAGPGAWARGRAAGAGAAPAAVLYAAGGALLLVIAGVVLVRRRRAQH